MGKSGYVKKGRTPVEGLREITTAGTPESLQPGITANTIALVTGTPATLTDSGNKFVLKGFKAGDEISISGSTADDGQYTVATVVAGTITLATGETLTGELAGVNTLTITKVGRIACRDLTVQALESNTSTKLAVSKSSNLDLSTGQGFVLAKLNTFTYQGIYLDEIYVDVGTNGDGVFYEYTEKLL